MTRQVVFLLHGLGANAATLWPLATWMRRQHDRVHNISYNVGAPRIDEMVASADAAMREHADPDEDTVVLVGHSMGGLVANRLHTRGWRVSAAVYIASPLRGARLVGELEAVLPARVADALRREIYAVLQAKEPERPPAHPYRTISVSWPGTSFDGRVYRDEACLDEACHVHLPWADHCLVVANPRLWYWVERLVAECRRQADATGTRMRPRRRRKRPRAPGVSD